MIFFHNQINIKVCRYYDWYFFILCQLCQIHLCLRNLLYFFLFFLAFGRVFFSALMLCKPGFYFLFRNNASFKTVSGEIKAVMPKIVASRREEHFQLCYLIMVLQIFTTPTNSGCFINVYHTNPIS